MSTPNDRHGTRSPGPNWSRINQWLLWIGLAAAVAWMFFRDNEHLVLLLPFLILLACSLMHLFGHGAHDRDAGRAPQDAAKPNVPRVDGGHKR